MEQVIATAEVKTVKKSIGQTVRDMVSENPSKSNKELLASIMEVFPEAKTTEACIAWYKSDMRKKGLLNIGGRTSPMSADGIRAKIKELEAQIEKLKDKLFVLEGDSEDTAPTKVFEGELEQPEVQPEVQPELVGPVKPARKARKASK